MNKHYDGTTCSYSLYTENAEPGGRKTFVIFGMARGGTTMVAGVARRCGMDIGSELPVNLEDNDFNANVLKGRGKDPVEHIVRTLRERNRSGKPVWGWKFPRAVAYLEKVREHIVNPQLIVVVRDAIATSGRRINSGEATLEVVNDVMRVQRRNMDLVERWQVPTLLVSYEKAITFPEAFIDELAVFTGFEPPRDRSEILSFMVPGSYKDA